MVGRLEDRLSGMKKALFSSVDNRAKKWAVLDLNQ